MWRLLGVFLRSPFLELADSVWQAILDSAFLVSFSQALGLLVGCHTCLVFFVSAVDLNPVFTSGALFEPSQSCVVFWRLIEVTVKPSVVCVA